MIPLILFMIAIASEQSLQQLKVQQDALQRNQQLLDRLKLQTKGLRLQQAGAAWAQGRERTCAIPLLNALKEPMPPNPMPVMVPEGQFHIREVVPPAPSCDDGKK